MLVSFEVISSDKGGGLRMGHITKISPNELLKLVNPSVVKFGLGFCRYPEECLDSKEYVLGNKNNVGYTRYENCILAGDNGKFSIIIETNHYGESLFLKIDYLYLMSLFTTDAQTNWVFMPK